MMTCREIMGPAPVPSNLTGDKADAREMTSYDLFSGRLGGKCPENDERHQTNTAAQLVDVAFG
jgi:hypothetical protein